LKKVSPFLVFGVAGLRRAPSSPRPDERWLNRRAPIVSAAVATVPPAVTICERDLRSKKEGSLVGLPSW